MNDTGIVDNQIGTLQHPVPHGTVPYPGLRNIIDKGYSDFNTTRNRVKLYRVPNATVDLGETIYELPEPFLHGSVLYFRNGVLEALTTLVELNNLQVQIPEAVTTGTNRETVEFEYLPAYIVGRNAYKNKLSFSFDSSRTLTDIMVWYSIIRLNPNETEITITLPSLNSTHIGSRVIFFRRSKQRVYLSPPSGTTIDEQSGLYTLVNDLDAVEMIYSEVGSTKRWNTTGRLGF